MENLTPNHDRDGGCLEAKAALGYSRIMSDDLYDRDALAWSERQAALLRRVARGERVNDVDWDHVVEEIEDVGISELNAVQSHLEQILVHLLKLRGWPEVGADQHWRPRSWRCSPALNVALPRPCARGSTWRKSTAGPCDRSR